VANVKWLTRIDVIDRRFTGRFMARDYVSIREGQSGGQAAWTFTTVGRDRLKSAPAKVTRRGGEYTIMGAAWSAPVRMAFWTFDWGAPSSGEHSVRSRAYDLDGNVQPTPEHPFLTRRRTYWESNGQITRRVMIR
jgi:hypothetical protein